MKRILFFVLLLSFGANAQEPAFRTSADIYLGLRKLNVLGSVLYLAAHPDDENTRLLAYLAKDRMYRTGYLSLTRGDGGQNLIGDEQGVELGLIRTQELLAARRIDGAEQFFTRAFDFGFSKTPVETFTKWDREKILSDVVWVIRRFQPDVIITRFPTTGEGGHGHHTASAILANEAFTAAADPKRFPEQLKWVRPWQAKRIFWNTFNFGSNNTIREDQHHFDVGGYNPVLGKSYGEIAADSRSQHKSQGFGVPRQRGEALEYFKQTGGAAFSKDIMDDVDLGWERMPGGAAIRPLVNTVLANYDFMAPQKSVPALIVLYKALQAAPQSYWRDQKLSEVKGLIESASGLWVEAFSNEPYAVQGDSVKLNFVLNSRLGVPVTLERIRTTGLDTAVRAVAVPNRNVSLLRSLYVDSSFALTQPYWLQEKMQEGYYTVTEQELIGRPAVQPSFEARFEVSIEGVPFTLTRPVRYKYTDPVKGEQYQPLYIIPAATITTGPDVLLLPRGDKEPRQAVAQINAHKDVKGPVEVELRGYANSGPVRDNNLSLPKNANKQYPFQVSGSDRFTKTDSGLIFQNRLESALAYAHFKGADEHDAYVAMRAINYAHIPSIRYFLTDPLSLLNIDLKTRGKKVGYIVGAGDKVPAALEQMGYDVTLLGEKELQRLNLKSFDAIISGVRAYNTNDWLNPLHTKLMKYVEEGGNLIVQYNTSNQIGPVRAKIGPYNFNITRNRVTDENAAVTILRPEHPVLNFPNKINATDFNGWIQERSIYHAATNDLPKEFETIFRMNDPGEAPDDGSLIVAKYGKGYFTYTGIVFFRELPAGVPGAYRLLANLIALNQKKEL
ncbi:MAG: PIG-L family deacetylase [Chitinophagaceae bacterium]|nr:MAG: PIG-L family deacetylase [Chitinophagaceae bacterium]